MNAPAAGWSHTVLVHLHRLRSPLGVALLTAAFCLLLALLLIRQRRRRNLATVRERTAVLRTSPAALRRPQANVAAAAERKSITSRVAEFVRRRRPPDLSEVLGPYRITSIEGRRATDDAWTLLTLPALKAAICDARGPYRRNPFRPLAQHNARAVRDPHPAGGAARDLAHCRPCAHSPGAGFWPGC